MGKFFGGLLRLLATAGISVGMIFAVYIVNSIFGGDGTPSYLFAAPFLITVVCIVNHLLYDVLGIGILDNIVGKIIKLIVFFGLWVGMLLIQGMSCDLSQLQYEGDGWLAEILCYASVVAGNVATLLYSMAIKSEQEDGLFYIPLVSFGASLVVGLAFTILGAVIPNFIEFGTWIAFALSALAVVGFMLWKGVPYTDTEGVIGGGRSYGRSSGRSSGGYGYGGGYNNNNYNNNNYNDDNYGGYVDNRTYCSNAYDKLKSRLDSVCNYTRGQYYSTSNIEMGLRAYATLNGNVIHFYMSGWYKIDRSVTTEYAHSLAQSDYDYAKQCFFDNLVDNAKHEIDKLREDYTNFDGAYDFEGHSNNFENRT